MRIHRHKDKIILDTHTDNVEVELTSKQALDLAQGLLECTIDIRDNSYQASQFNTKTIERN